MVAPVAPMIRETVQNLPDARLTKGLQAVYLGGRPGTLLPAWGSREREYALRNVYDRNDYALLWQGASAGLIKRWSGTPWEIAGQENRAAYFQSVLNNAQFGASWSRFIEPVGRDFLRQDGGAYIEVIAPGNPLEPINAPISGLAHLDSLHCYPTGDPEYPVLYIEVRPDYRQTHPTTTWHLMHKSRVLQLVDMPDGDALNPGYGLCALSRAIRAVRREILMSRYVETALDDVAPPGLLIFGNIASNAVDDAISKMSAAMNTDMPAVFGKTVMLYGVSKEQTPTVESYTYSNPPEKFDLKTYTELCVNEIALALGIDKLDMWEITSSGLGSGMQAEIMAQKSKGRTYGAFLVQFERAINQLLPDDLTFEFKPRDEQEDKAMADAAQAYANVLQLVESKLSPDEFRQALANQIPFIRDAITDESGLLRRFNDVDIQPQDVAPFAPSIPATPPIAQEAIATDATPLDVKAFGDTRAEFVRNIADLTAGGLQDEVSRRRFGIVMRAQLNRLGRQAYTDGLREGGVEDDLEAEDSAELLGWLAKQSGYVTKFADDVYKGRYSENQVQQHAELWASKSLQDAYNLGLLNSGTNGAYTWKLGIVEEHCEICPRLAGQVHRFKAWSKSGYLPGFHFGCACRLEKTRGLRKGNF